MHVCVPVHVRVCECAHPLTHLLLIYQYTKTSTEKRGTQAHKRTKKHKKKRKPQVKNTRIHQQTIARALAHTHRQTERQTHNTDRRTASKTDRHTNLESGWLSVCLCCVFVSLSVYVCERHTNLEF